MTFLGLLGRGSHRPVLSMMSRFGCLGGLVVMRCWLVMSDGVMRLMMRLRGRLMRLAVLRAGRGARLGLNLA